MTRDEAHRRASEAAESAWKKSVRGYGVEEAIDAYLAAMVLPIEEAPNKETILIFYDTKEISLVQAEENDYEWQPYQPRGSGIASPKFFNFLPDPPK